MFGNFKSFCCLLLFLCLTGGSTVSGFGQEKKPPKPPKTKEYIMPTPGADPQPGFFNGDGVTMERSIAADPGVTIKLCVAEGELRINGWRRDEVRVFVKHGRKLNLKSLEDSPETRKVKWLLIGSAGTSRLGPASDCLAGERIEIDAPVGASLDLSGREVRTSVDSLKEVKAKIVAGAITLRNIKGGINAYTGRGDLLVENSAGAISLEGTTGNIVAVEVSPGQIGDLFRAKTNSGAISLQRVEHKQIETISISGSLLFEGKFLKGGLYTFRTSNGSIDLLIPIVSSCMFKVSYGIGNFKHDLPLTILTENATPEAKIVVAKIGSGEAQVSLRTVTGSIEIRKSGSKL